jgi:hypothetical protein
MDERVFVQGPAGVAEPLAYQVEQGTWWPDKWITPVLQLRLRSLKGASRVLVSGFQPALAPRQIDNRVTLEAGGAKVCTQLEWDRTFESVLRLDPPVAGDLDLQIEVENWLPSDALSPRDRGIPLLRVTVHQEP